MRLLNFALGFTVAALAGGCARLPESPPVSLSAEKARQAEKFKTWKDVRQQHVVMQRYDYSCGAAAMATLMRYYFGEDITERDVLLDILEHISAEATKKRKKEGFSLLDLKEYAERHGYQAAGVDLELEALRQLVGPVLVYLETDGYKHFAILRGSREDRVFLADPSRGNVSMPVSRFVKQWSGITLVLGKEGFGTPAAYPLAVDSASPFRPQLQAARRALYLRP
jgi:predicted double-glycine peptidase